MAPLSSSSSELEIVEVTPQVAPTGRGHRIRKAPKRDDEIVELPRKVTPKKPRAPRVEKLKALVPKSKAMPGSTKTTQIELSATEDEGETTEDDSQLTIVASNMPRPHQPHQPPQHLQATSDVPAQSQAPAELPNKTPSATASDLSTSTSATLTSQPHLEPAASLPISEYKPVMRAASTSAIPSTTQRSFIAASSSQDSNLIVIPATSSSPARQSAPPVPRPSSARKPVLTAKTKDDGNDSDDMDNFFMRRNAAPTTKKRVPMRRPGGSGATVPAPPAANPVPSSSRAAPPSSSRSHPPPLSSDSTSSSDVEIFEEEGDPLLDLGKKYKIPAWAKAPAKSKKRARSSSTPNMMSSPPHKLRDKGKRKTGQKATVDDIDSDLEIADVSGPKMARATEQRNEGRISRSRSRSRNRSLTPPEQVSKEQMERILRIAQEDLYRPNSDAEPTRDERHTSIDSEDADLPPEMREVQLNYRNAISNRLSDSSVNASASNTAGEPALIRLVLVRDYIRYNAAFDPTLDISTELTMSADESFTRIFAIVATSFGLDPAETVLTFRRVQIYQFGTPRSVKMTTDGTTANEVRVFDANVWELAEELRMERADRLVREGSRGRERSTGPGKNGQVIELGEDDSDEDLVELDYVSGIGRVSSDSLKGASPVAEVASSQPAIDPHLVRLTVRGSAKSAFGFAVKRTFSLRKLLGLYCKKEGITDQARIRGMSIEWDGEKVDLEDTVGGLEDFENEDTLDVKG